MSKIILIKNAIILNEGKSFKGFVLIKDGLIFKVFDESELRNIEKYAIHSTINAEGLHLFPGLIDDQVHFREPGLTHKADIYTESRAAVAGGITSYMDMPNTNPATITLELLEQKFEIAEKDSLANYSFYFGATNNNLNSVKQINPKRICGVKVFMGSSTGNMLVDDTYALEKIFGESPVLIATHCEDEKIIEDNLIEYKKKYGENIPILHHPQIRSESACFLSSSKAVDLAIKYNSRLHILHISTEKELSLFSNLMSIQDKNITAEACIHHLWFTSEDYQKKGSLIKWNPAVKEKSDREALIQAINNNTIDIIATDHAPHTFEEKQRPYTSCPSGGPLVQHLLVALLEMYHNNTFSLEKIVEKTSHSPAKCFNIEKRGYIREGYFADLVLVNLNDPWEVKKENILYKCTWSPFENQTFRSKVIYTFVNGKLVYDHGDIYENSNGMALSFST